MAGGLLANRARKDQGRPYPRQQDRTQKRLRAAAMKREREVSAIKSPDAARALIPEHISQALTHAVETLCTCAGARAARGHHDGINSPLDQVQR